MFYFDGGGFELDVDTVWDAIVLRAFMLHHLSARMHRPLEPCTNTREVYTSWAEFGQDFLEADPFFEVVQALQTHLNSP